MRALVSLCILSTATAAWAAPPGLEEIERGIFVAVGAGPSVLFNPPAAEGTPRPTSFGQQVELSVGLHLAERLALELFVVGGAQRAGAEYVGTSGGLAQGDFFRLIPGAAARLSLLAFPDSQGVHRTFVYARGGAGYAFFAPGELLSNPELILFAGGGVEYHTRLRHFSVALDVSMNGSLGTLAFGVTVTPSLRYAF